MKKFDNFCKALENLQEIYAYEAPYSNVILTGLVGLYEICFEQSRKAMKESLYASGIGLAATGSPKAIIKEAFSNGMIQEEQLWLDALSDQKHVAHAYNPEIAGEIVENTKEKYVAMFQELKTSLEEWQGLTSKAAGTKTSL
ncbi:nucleotidyltransferase [Lachnospiraceae bacterium]|jgi:nucleotidyltransferase substrate binding protein (TIGR01987 family)|nr:HI0074 family nucleotidyltransferase substrate-binding subunit [uncultured Schaedlerella sp.]NBI59857.1 nucleotidyltransferase [Lachnospiraceae bacterium]